MNNITGDETQELINVYKRSDGVMDWYKVLGVSKIATDAQIEMAFHLLSATYHPKTGSGGKESAVRYALLQKAFEELSDPARRKRYDAFCRFQYDHARLLVAIDTERQKQQIAKMPGAIERLLHRVDTRPKRIALLAFPFLAVIAGYRLDRDVDYYGDPSLSFFLFFMASVLCLLIAFTRLGDWLAAP